MADDSSSPLSSLESSPSSPDGASDERLSAAAASEDAWSDSDGSGRAAPTLHRRTWKRKNPPGVRGRPSRRAQQQQQRPAKVVGGWEPQHARAQQRPQPAPAPPFCPVERTVQANPDISLVVMFRAKFRSLFHGIAEFGCQDIEEGVSGIETTPLVEELIARLVSLCLNRRKAIERDAYTKFLQECIGRCYDKVGDPEWHGENPLQNGATFQTVDWDTRVRILKTLVLYALQVSDAVREIIEAEYRPMMPKIKTRDALVGIAVLPIGTIQKSRYWLIEGKDTRFRLFAESDPSKAKVNWEPIADDVPSIQKFAEKLEAKNLRTASELAETIKTDIVPRLELTALRKKKAERAAERLAMFRARVPVYATRTRGHRVNYAALDGFSDSDNREGRSKQNKEIQPPLEVSTMSGRISRRPRWDNSGFASVASSHFSADVEAPEWQSDDGINGLADDEGDANSTISHPDSFLVKLPYKSLHQDENNHQYRDTMTDLIDFPKHEQRI